MTSRSGLPYKTETDVLLRSRRRCAICFGLNRDASVKQGQIAHLDRDRSNNKVENLAFLCLDHHDQYDSRMSQSKGLKITELKYFRAELEEALRFAFSAPIELHKDQTAMKAWEGVFRWETNNASAELQIYKSAKGTPDCYSVSGIAFWGTQNLYGPQTGDFDADAVLAGDHLVLKNQDYELSMMLTGSGLSAQETCGRGMFGMNVTFEGQYHRVPTGGDALPQTTMRRFESEFWPEEGIPVFEAKCSRLALRARPSIDAPVSGYLLTAPGSRVAYSGFRYRTLRPGLVVVHKDYTLTGRNLGRTDYVSVANYYDDGGELVTLQLESSDRLEYLQYRAEGSGFIRWQGLVLDIESLPWLGSNRPLELVVNPVNEAWIRVESESDMTTGWIPVDEDETVFEIDREF